jgi:hypothetical protein
VTPVEVRESTPFPTFRLHQAVDLTSLLANSRVCQAGEAPNVMRGDETQIVGALAKASSPGSRAPLVLLVHGVSRMVQAVV